MCVLQPFQLVKLSLCQIIRFLTLQCDKFSIYILELQCKVAKICNMWPQRCQPRSSQD